MTAKHLSRWLVSTALLLFATLGCQKNTTKTYAVTGQVLYKDGTPLKEGSVRFSSAADPLLIIAGPVSENGSFTVNTVLPDGTRVPGTIAGDHAINVDLPQGADQVSPQVRQDITQVTVGTDKNHFVIKIEKVEP